MAGMLGGLLSLVGIGVQFVMSRKDAKPGEPQRDWVPTEAERQAIAQPLANIALRHSPADDLGEATDLVDGIGVAAAGIGYALRASTGAPGGVAEQKAQQQQQRPEGAPT